MDTQDPELLGGAAPLNMGGYMFANPHAIAQQSGDTDQASGLGFPLAVTDVVVNVPVPVKSGPTPSNFEIHMGENPGFVENPGSFGSGELV